MIDSVRLKEYSRPELLDLAEIYSSYVLLYKKNYKWKAKYRIGLSAVFDITILLADRKKVMKVYKKSPQLEDEKILRAKLNTLDDEQLCDLLAYYDVYIINLDRYSIGGCAPVCLDEFLDIDYKEYKTELLCCRLNSQMETYEAALVAEGAVAMRNKNKRLLDIVERFYEAFCNYDYNEEALEAAAALARDNALIPAIVNWSEGRDIYLAVISDTLGIFFDQFCRSIMKG